MFQCMTISSVTHHTHNVKQEVNGNPDNGNGVNTRNLPPVYPVPPVSTFKICVLRISQNIVVYNTTILLFVLYVNSIEKIINGWRKMLLVLRSNSISIFLHQILIYTIRCNTNIFLFIWNKGLEFNPFKSSK